MKESVHVPVLLQEVLTGLALRPGAIVVDATLGGGGYTSAICDAIGKKGIVVSLDQDADAVENAKDELTDAGCTLHLVNANFRTLAQVLEKLHVENVDVAVFDLGFSSTQLEESSRGFSFQRDEPLLMTYHTKPSESDITAEQIVNNWSEEAIADVLFGYGEERYARRIARHIVEARKTQPIKTSKDLVEIIERSVPKKKQRLHVATKTFQALRIAVNDELEALKEGLEQGFEILSSRGRMAVVSFHSLEDRIVKRFFREMVKEGKAKFINKRPIVPTGEEVINNPRSRSAKLRIIEKL